jgi:ribonuclease HI
MYFFKLNFDSTSKGNLGTVGFREMIRNHQGRIFLLTIRNLGHTTKNATKLWGLTTGLQLALKHHFNKLIVEGDSQIILNLF